MAHYKSIVAYDGTNFYGFQRQSPGSNLRTVQSEIETRLTQIGWTENSILAAGRTDTGVHASGQVISFKLDWKHTTRELTAAINNGLADEISIQSIEEISDGFHPRFDAVSRRYKYQIYVQPVRDPLRDRFAWKVWPDVNDNLMNEAARILIGNHNFRNFGKPHKTGGSTKRNVFHSKWSRLADNLVYEVEANAFLYHMVRRIVKLLIEVGHNRINIEYIKEILRSEDKAGPQGIAPPNGLILEEVVY